MLLTYLPLPIFTFGEEDRILIPTQINGESVRTAFDVGVDKSIILTLQLHKQELESTIELVAFYTQDYRMPR